jgi:glucosamine--fructose-6-phosphate aminotransferase (isomerizing)
MCGIIGYTGPKSAAPLLLDGLQKLEYRGYDSAGIATICEGNIQFAKTPGKLTNLLNRTHNGSDLQGTCGIGHTRWATHGVPNELNAHPHMSQSGKLCIVHNGIIENYAEIKEFLTEKGYHFISDTDTETAIQLIDYFYFKTKNLLQAVLQALHRIEGAYAMVILCADDPDTIISARKDAPLILGYGDGFNLVASDATALIAHTRSVAYMDDGEVAVVTPQSISVYDLLGQPVKKELHTIDWDISAAEKGGYPHFMLKEIMEEPKAIQKTVSPRIKDGKVDLGELKLTPEQIKNADIIYIIACGSSYHVGMVAKYTLEGLTHKLVLPVLASEFCYSDPLVTENSLAIIISQSGETHDTMEALKVAKQKGAHILSIVNVVGSSIARASDDVLYTWAGPEIAVATTKAYTTQLVLLDLLGLYLADCLGTIEPEEYAAVLEELNWIPEKVESILQNTDQIKFLASRYFNHNSIFFIGRNIDYALCMEGSLKLKEISYIHSEAYAAGELKHGTISLIENGTLVFALATYTPLFEKIRSNIVEVASRGAEVLALTTVSKTDAVSAVADNVISVPDTHPILQPSLGVVPLQLFAYYMALQRGCDIDKPRNLAKSVTVE